ncbi:MAG: alanine--glyoxylate aminotransferase family protein [Deinococcales bacterium]
MGPIKSRLLAPGPVEVPPAVLEAMARPVVHHRSEAFQELFASVRSRLAEVAMVPGEEVLVVTGSGTAGFEAALLACVPAGGTVVSLHAGKFGERWASMAKRFGFSVIELAAPWGRTFDPQRLREVLRAAPDVAAVTTTHSETSTGVLHDVEAIASVVRQEAPDALVVVDAVTSLAAAELRPRAWDLDVVVSGSQKGLMVPPGLAFAYLSERAWGRSDELSESGRLAPSYYLDLRRERQRQAQNQTATTPAVSLVAGLDVALRMLLQEGIEAVWARRAALNQAVLAAGEAIGLSRYAVRPSPAVAALRTPEGVEAGGVIRQLASQGIRIGAGQDAAKPHLLRPSVLGYADRFDAITLAAALEDALRALGRDVPFGAGPAATLRSLAA